VLIDADDTVCDVRVEVAHDERRGSSTRCSRAGSASTSSSSCCSRSLVAFAGLLVAVILMVWFERKLIADMQNRLGPNRAGPFGILQTLADGMKLIFKEDLIPDAPTGSCSSWRRS
jgi:hypothetical protein